MTRDGKNERTALVFALWVHLLHILYLFFSLPYPFAILRASFASSACLSVSLPISSCCFCLLLFRSRSKMMANFFLSYCVVVALLFPAPGFFSPLISHDLLLPLLC